MEIRFASSSSLTPACREKMKEAVSRVFRDEPVRMVRSEPGPGVVGFGIDSGIRTLGPREIEEYPTAVGFLTHAFSRLKPVVPLVPWDCDPSKILYLDIETHNAGKQFSMPAREFFRLGQYAWGPSGEVTVTTDYDEVIEAIRLAEGVIAHNGHNFDFSVLFGADSTEALQMAMDGKLFDTMVFAALACPAPDVYVNRAGVTQYVKKPEMALKWLSLDNLCYQLGTDGKEGNLKELAARHDPKGTRVSDLDYGLIPLDDPEFLAYAVQDVKSLQELTNALLTLATPSDYDWREQLNAAIDAQNTRNGLRVDVPKAKARVEELRVRREALMADLESRYGFPTEGKMPWRTNPGKEAILKALADVGVTPETHPDWPKTKTGNISLGGEALVDLTSGTQAAELGQALAELMGQRSLAQLALDSVHPDGKAHPDISALQRSGRKCLPTTHKLVTRRGLLSWNEIKYGDETIDMRGQWVRVMAIHHYENQEVHRYQNRAVLLESTPEHKWVQTTESSNMRTLAPIEAKSRRVLQLTPDAYPFDPRELWYPRDLTERERVAALVGLLVTDGRCATRSDSPNSIATYVYQTEGKFYLEMKDVLLDEWVVSDSARTTDAHTLLHEIRLDSQKMRTLLEAEGLDLSGNLRHSTSVLDWVLTLNNREALAFLTSVWLADGAVTSGGASISCKKPNLVPAIQMAAYMCGRRSNFRQYANKRDSYVQGVIHITRDRVSVRNLPAPELVQSDVWCVTTETGTFTAWAPEGDFSAPYLTGNSTTRPGLTVWSSHGDKSIEKSYFIPNADDELLVEMDYSNADQRIIAAYSGDAGYAQRFDEGVDGHEINGRIMFGDEVYDSNPKFYRNAAKAPGHAYTYGAGPGKLAATTGLPYDTMLRFCRGMEETYPDVAAWQKQVRKEGESGAVLNDWGRKMVLDPEKSWTVAPALYGQSGTREIVVDALIRMLRFDMRIIQFLVIQVHDALVFSIPEKDVEWAVPKIKELMECWWGPSDGTGQVIHFPVGVGKPGKTWQEASHI